MLPANKYNHYAYNRNLRPLAHALRNNMTKAECCLWKHVLRARMMKGYGFRRQRPVLQYIADFMCKELMLVIEVDGATHDDERVAINDLKREKDLTDAGFTVLRFTDEEVLNKIEMVWDSIEKWIDEYESKNRLLPPR